MVLASSDILQAKITQETPDHKRRLDKLKSSLRLAYKAVEKANRASHRKTRGFTIVNKDKALRNRRSSLST